MKVTELLSNVKETKVTKRQNDWIAMFVVEN